MKKINLKEISEVLSDAELKNVLGGVVTTGSSNCYVKCGDDSTYGVDKCPISSYDPVCAGHNGVIQCVGLSSVCV